MSEAKEDKKPEKKTLSLGGTLSLGTAGEKIGANIGQSRGGGVAVEMRSRRKVTTEKTAAAKGGDENPDADSVLREARLKALQAAQEEGSRRTSLPKRTIVQKPVEAPKETSSSESTADDLRQKELDELKSIELEEDRMKAETAQAQQEKFATSKIRTTTEVTGKDGAPGKQKKTLQKVPARTARSRRGGRMTVNQALNADADRIRAPSMASQRRAREKARLMAQGFNAPTEKTVREVIVPEFITVQELSIRMAEPARDVVRSLMKMGVMATINETIDADTAELIIDEFGHTVRRVTDADVEIGLDGPEDAAETLVKRPPVVTIMGHVDHGKTSLLDALRSGKVADGEAGGITQHIAAYQINSGAGEKITFLDTPGHAAFSEMRARGANITDICVIVVAANDSVMPQTIEAIRHAKAAEVPIIIAINKIDLHDADPQKVKTQLLQHEVIVEDLSGDVQCIEISAKEKTNLDKLEEAIILQSEILELKANPDRPAIGAVVESKMDKGRGSVVTLLVQKGTLRVGDIFVVGTEYGRVRALFDDKGRKVKKALPGQPVEVLGLGGTPNAGSILHVTQDEARAREVAQYRIELKKEKNAVNAIKGRTTMEQLLAQREEGEVQTLPVVIKGDVHGSVEAIVSAFEKMVEENEGIAIKVLHAGAGAITESDVTLAAASGCLIIGFNVRANAQALALTKRDLVDMRYYNVIYNVLDDVKAIMSGMLSPTIREEYIGQAKILEVFNITKVGKIAGSVVESGAVRRGNKVRLLRDNVVIHEGMLKVLKHFKDEVAEVKEGMECGMAFENYEDLKVGDLIECYDVFEDARVVT